MTKQIFDKHELAEEGYKEFFDLCQSSGLTQKDFDVRPHTLAPEELIFTYQRRLDLILSRGDNTDQIDQLIRAVKRAVGEGHLNWAIGRIGGAEIQVLLLEGKYLSHIMLEV